ncbi:MAG: MaoC/PaaZ C-terminal domain-containing protein [Arenicellales bacterium]|nr:MaoC/PaaZ C-terminal domain-containing protein [Arenicellales bacterium]
MESWKYFEDFEDGFVFHFEVPALTKEEIISFARNYDPQRFHVDAVEAEKTHFGGLVASGFQTQLLCFQPFCRQVLNSSFAVGAPGIDELKWLRPWYPGEKLKGSVQLVKKRKSTSRNDRGYLEFLLQAGVDKSPVFSMLWTVIIMTREGIDPSGD